MTDEELAAVMALTADVVAGRIYVRFDEETAWLAILNLRREVERLRAENATMREIVQAVAHGDGRGCLCTDEPVFESIGEDVFRFAGVKHPHIHAPDCPVTKARAWLAAHEEQS